MYMIRRIKLDRLFLQENKFTKYYLKIKKKESFEYIKLKIQENEKIADTETIKYLIGSKCDLTSQRAVKAETALVKIE